MSDLQKCPKCSTLNEADRYQKPSAKSYTEKSPTLGLLLYQCRNQLCGHAYEKSCDAMTDVRAQTEQTFSAADTAAQAAYKTDC